MELRTTDHDRYGRTIADYDNGHHLNYDLVEAGYAWWYRKYSKDPNLTNLEQSARQAHRGLWSDPDPTAPWDYRHHKHDLHATAAHVSPVPETHNARLPGASD